MASAPITLSEEVAFLLYRAGAGTETPRIPSWLSQPPPRPKYQPSPAKAGVLKAAATTVAMASNRSFIFRPSLKLPTGGAPAKTVKTNIELITAVPENVSRANAALRQINAQFPRFYPKPVTHPQQRKTANSPILPVP